MKLRFAVPTFLRTYCDGSSEVDLEGHFQDVRGALDELFRRYPALSHRILTEGGDVRPHVNIFVEAEAIRFLQGLDTRVKDGATLTLLPAISGGD